MKQGFCFLFALLSLILFPVPNAIPFAYIFSGESNGINVVTHPIGYNGTGGTLNITVGIDPLSPHAAEMEIPTQNVISVMNKLFPSTANLIFGTSNNIPSGNIDFESTLLHELGHSLGLAHVNAATESGLNEPERNFTKATDGIDNVYTLDAGVDAVRGSSDDIRGDDVNLNYFKILDNNPFTIDVVVDATTYSRDQADLPPGHTFSTNADRTVGSVVYGLSNTECIMQQGTYTDEAQRFLTADDVAGLRYAMAGIDELDGTADDYTFNLIYAGLDASADLVIQFDNNETGFAVSKSSGTFLNGSAHIAITNTNIYFNTGFNWFFNDVSNSVFPVEFIAFEVNKEGGKTILNWSTATEVNSSHFVIERSEDALAWETIGITEAAGNSSEEKVYNFWDQTIGLVGQAVFYRLKEVDKDGNFMYSDIIEYQNELNPLNTLEFAPNPIDTHTLYEWELGEDHVTSFRVINMEGKLVFQEHVASKRGYNLFKLGEKLHLTPGLYILQVVAGPYIQSLKFVKQ